MSANNSEQVITMRGMTLFVGCGLFLLLPAAVLAGEPMLAKRGVGYQQHAGWTTLSNAGPYEYLRRTARA